MTAVIGPDIDHLALSMRPPQGSAFHRGSHSRLLNHVDPPERQAKVDAIIVPTIRPPTVLKDVLMLGQAVGCPVVVLCSGWSRARDVSDLASTNGAEVIAIDVLNSTAMPAFGTSALLAPTRFKQTSDLSLKRNTGLALARMMGWQRIVYLDDDITGIEPEQIMTAASLLTSFDIVALENVGFPDNSVVCHALRRAGTLMGVVQDSFVGGGAMAVAVDRTESFFPNIYNEDWFFMLGLFMRQLGQHPVAITGKVQQKPYNPYLDSSRAKVEELGDCLAEGVYALLDDGKSIQHADHAFWEAFLADRGRLLQLILEAIPNLGLEVDRLVQMTVSIKAAQDRHGRITPAFCVEYLKRWQADQKTWGSYLQGLPRDRELHQALTHLVAPQSD